MQIFTGIYEQVINRIIDEELKKINPDQNIIKTANIDPAEAQHVLAEYLEQVIEKV